MVKFNRLGAGLILLMCFSLKAEAKLYKWVDDNGTTHYGEVIPPEYANKERDALGKSGKLEKRPEKKTLKDAATEEREKIENQASMEQERRDSALLNTYSNEHEIDLARDRSLVLINARIDSNRILLKSSQSILDDLKKENETRLKQGKKIPHSLTADIADREAKVAKFTSELNKSEEELAIVKARFDKDKELYRKLKGDTAVK